MNTVKLLLLVLFFCGTAGLSIAPQKPEVNVRPVKKNSSRGALECIGCSLSASAAVEMSPNKNWNYNQSDIDRIVYPPYMYTVGHYLYMGSIFGYVWKGSTTTPIYACVDMVESLSLKLFLLKRGEAFGFYIQQFGGYGCPENLRGNDNQFNYDDYTIFSTDIDGSVKYFAHLEGRSDAIYLVTWSDAAEKNMSSDMQTYKGYTNVCYPSTHLGPKYYGMYTIVNSSDIVLGGFLTSDCSGPAADSQVVKPNTVGQSGNRYFTAVGKPVAATAQIFSHCDVYDGVDHGKYTGTILYNQCEKDPMRNGYIWLYMTNNRMHIDYFSDSICSASSERIVGGGVDDLPINEKDYVKIRIYNDWQHINGDHTILVRLNCYNRI